MSVKKYTPIIDWKDYLQFASVKEADQGEFVRIEDYDRLKAEVERLTNCKSESDRLKAEVERLRASSFVTAVPVEEYEKLKAEVERSTTQYNGIIDAQLKAIDDLKAEVERLEQESAKWRRAEHAVGDKCIEFAKTIQTLKAEVERLRKAGDAMEQEVIGCYFEQDDPADSESLRAWRAAKEGKSSV